MTLQQLNFTEVQITESVCKHLNVSFQEIGTRSRERRYAYARMVCMFMLQYYTRMSQREISDLFSRDRSTVHHAIKTINNLLQVDDIVRKDISAIKTMIGQ